MQKIVRGKTPERPWHFFVEIVGWYGTLAIVTAYALVSFKVVESNGLVYQILNLTGAAGIAVDAFYKMDYQPAVLNVVWIGIALAAIIRMFI